MKRKQEILPYLERLHAELDIPVLYVSHSPDEVARLARFAGLGADQGGGADWLGLARHFFEILIKLACSPYAASAGSYIFSIKRPSIRCTDMRQSHSDPSESGSGGQCGRHGRHPGAGKRCQRQVNMGDVLLA